MRVPPMSTGGAPSLEQLLGMPKKKEQKEPKPPKGDDQEMMALIKQLIGMLEEKLEGLVDSKKGGGKGGSGGADGPEGADDHMGPEGPGGPEDHMGPEGPGGPEDDMGPEGPGGPEDHMGPEGPDGPEGPSHRPQNQSSGSNDQQIQLMQALLTFLRDLLNILQSGQEEENGGSKGGDMILPPPPDYDDDSVFQQA